MPYSLPFPLLFCLRFSRFPLLSFSVSLHAFYFCFVSLLSLSPSFVLSFSIFLFFSFPLCFPLSYFLSLFLSVSFFTCLRSSGLLHYGLPFPTVRFRALPAGPGALRNSKSFAARKSRSYQVRSSRSESPFQDHFLQESEPFLLRLLASNSFPITDPRQGTAFTTRTARQPPLQSALSIVALVRRALLFPRE